MSVPAEDFALGPSVTADGGRLWLERVVPLGDAFVPYVWASGWSEEVVEGALREAAAVESCAVVDRTTDGLLIRVEWSNRTGGFLDAVVASGATVLEGVGERSVWRFRLRFDDDEDLAACYRECAERGVPVEVERVYGPEARPNVGVVSALTETQRETLAVALDEGYFEVPRRITLVELADELGVSDTAVSQRLRRGLVALLRAIPIEDGATEATESMEATATDATEG